MCPKAINAETIAPQSFHLEQTSHNNGLKVFVQGLQVFVKSPPKPPKLARRPKSAPKIPESSSHPEAMKCNLVVRTSTLSLFFC